MRVQIPSLLIWFLAGILAGVMVNLYSSGTLPERLGMTLLIVAASGIIIALVGFLRARQNAPPASAPSQTESRTETLRNVALFAIVPPLLVVADRWFDNLAAAELFKPVWCQVDWLCHLALPPYFALVFVCMLIVFGFVWMDTPNWISRVIQGQDHAWSHDDRTVVPASPGHRRLRLRIIALVGIALLIARQIIFANPPGWEYAILCFLFLSSWASPDLTMEKIIRAGRQYGLIIVIGVIAHLALLSTLQNYFSTREMNVFSVGVFLLAGLGLVRYRRQIHPLYWIVSFALVLHTIDIDAWVFSTIGDEFSFYRYAREIVERQSFDFISGHLFWGNAVYGTHPYVSSLIQALVMRITDVQNFGWRFSSIYVSVGSLPFFYVFFQSFVREWIALTATCLLAASHYLMTFGKIGYNNTQALLAMGIALAAVAWAIRSAKPIAFALLGAALGFCFYVYPAALYVPAIPIMLLALYHPPFSRRSLHHWGVMLLAMGVLIAPLLVQEEYWTSKIAGTFLYNPRLTTNSTVLTANLQSNLVYAFFSFLYIPEETHFVTVAYVDPLTAALVLIGIATQIRLAFKNKFAFFLCASFGVLLFLVGASHDRDFPPTTRMFLMLPWFVLLAASGVDWLASYFRNPGPSLVKRVLLIGALLMILAVNLFQAYSVSTRSTQYQLFEAQFLRLAQNVAADKANAPTLLLVNDPELSDAPSLVDGLELHYLSVPFSELRVAATGFADTQTYHLLAPNQVVIINPRLPDDERAAYEEILSANQRVQCAMNAARGETRFTVWYPPDRPSPCASRDDLGVTALVTSANWLPLAILALGLLLWVSAGVGTFAWRFADSTRNAGTPDESAQPIPTPAPSEANSVALPSVARGETQQSGEALPYLGRRALLGEWGVIIGVVTLFALPFLNFDPGQLLPGNEFDVLATLDFVLVNALRNFGEFPLWNFYLRTGQPFVADPFLHVFNPFATIPILVWGVADGYKIALWLSFILAAIGQWLLARALGLNRTVRLWSAMIYAFNGQSVAKFFQGLYDFTLGYAWIPFVFVGIVMSLRTRRPRYCALTALALALLFFSGNTYYAYYTAIILGLYILVAGFEFGGITQVRWNSSRVAPVIISALLALGLVSAQLIPTVALWHSIEKEGDPALKTSQPLEEIALNYLSTSTDRPVAQENLPPEEFYGYIGIVPFIAAVLALGAFRKGRRKEILAWVMLFVFVIVWISVRYTPFAPLFERTSLLNQFRYPSRIMVFGALAVVVLGGIGLHWLMGCVEMIRASRGPASYIGGVMAIVLTGGLLFSVADIFQANRQLIGTRDVYQDASDILAWLHEHDPTPHYVSIPVSALWHYATASNDERYWDGWYGFDFNPPIRPDENLRPVTARPNYLVLGKDEMNVPSDAIVEQEFPRHRVYRLPQSLPYAFVVTNETLTQNVEAGELLGSEVRALNVTQTGPNTLRVEANTMDSKSWLVVLTDFYPGWRATVDGADAPLANIGDYVATPAPIGQHLVVFEFDPPLFKIGLVISFVALMLMLRMILLDK